MIRVVLPEPPPKVLVAGIAHFDELLRELATDQDRLYHLLKDGRAFEQFMAEFLASDGWVPTLTGATRDGGIDIFAHRPTDPFPIIYGWQCKRDNPRKPVGVEVVRSLAFAVPDNNASLGVICTTSTFSKDALDTMKRSRIIFPQDIHALHELAKKIRGDA